MCKSSSRNQKSYQQRRTFLAKVWYTPLPLDFVGSQGWCSHPCWRLSGWMGQQRGWVPRFLEVAERTATWKQVGDSRSGATWFLLFVPLSQQGCLKLFIHIVHGRYRKNPLVDVGLGFWPCLSKIPGGIPPHRSWSFKSHRKPWSNRGRLGPQTSCRALCKGGCQVFASCSLVTDVGIWEVFLCPLSSQEDATLEDAQDFLVSLMGLQTSDLTDHCFGPQEVAATHKVSQLRISEGPWSLPGSVASRNKAFQAEEMLVERWDVSFFSPNSVSTLWGSYGRSKEWCPSRCPSATAAFDCAGTHRVPFASTVSHGMVAAGFCVVLPGVVHVLKQNVVLRDRRGRSDGFGGSKRGFTWQVQGIGHIVKIVAGAVF